MVVLLSVWIRIGVSPGGLRGGFPGRPGIPGSARVWEYDRSLFVALQNIFPNMGWTYLLIAGLFEVAWAVGLKFTDGFTRWWPSIWVGTAMIASLFFLSLALRTIPLGTGYAVWTGIGAVGTAILGIVLFNEPANLVRVVCILLIVSGIVGLKLS